MHLLGLGRAILLVVCLLLVFSQSATGYKVSSSSVEPTGALVPGTPVLVFIRIDFPTQPLFPPSHDLRYTTELESPKWDPNIISAGIEYPAITQGGKVNSLSGVELSDPKVFAVRLQLGGVTPLVLRTSNITIFRIEEIDELGQVVKGSTFNYVTLVVNQTDYVTEFTNKNIVVEKKLEIFRSHIDEKSAIGVNTTTEEIIYSRARMHIDSAFCQCSEMTFIQSMGFLNLADEEISEGERLLDKAWAEQEVATAQIPINNVNAVIAEYKTNDQRLPAIIAKRELAVAYISYANDAIAIGNYSQARENADEAYELGNESYTMALPERQCLGRFCNFNQKSFGILIIGITVILLASICAYFYFRKHQKKTS
jgi:hypothetical protein